MSTVPKRPPAERETPTPRVRDHEHVSRLSTQTTIFALIAVALILYEIQWILPPFVFAALLAYITTPASNGRVRAPGCCACSLSYCIHPIPFVCNAYWLSRNSAACARNDSCF